MVDPMSSRWLPDAKVTTGGLPASMPEHRGKSWYHGTSCGAGSHDVQLYHDAAEATTWGLELSIENCGGVNAVVSWIELWSNAGSSTVEKYDPPRGMPASPAGCRLIAVDDCGKEDRQPDMQQSQNWTYSLSELPETICSQTDPARTMGYHWPVG